MSDLAIFVTKTSSSALEHASLSLHRGTFHKEFILHMPTLVRVFVDASFRYGKAGLGTVVVLPYIHQSGLWWVCFFNILDSKKFFSELVFSWIPRNVNINTYHLSVLARNNLEPFVFNLIMSTH